MKRYAIVLCILALSIWNCSDDPIECEDEQDAGSQQDVSEVDVSDATDADSLVVDFCNETEAEQAFQQGIIPQNQTPCDCPNERYTVPVDSECGSGFNGYLVCNNQLGWMYDEPCTEQDAD